MTEFRFEQCLGRGGFGEVYRGIMSRGGGVEVDVAIKVLRPDLDPDSQGVQRLRDEGRLLGRLTHPAILRVYDLVVIAGRAALVSEYVPGDDFGRLLRAESIPRRAIFEIIAQVAAALDAAWSWPSVTDGRPLHLVHRDVKPDNIRVDPHGNVKLLDFGIAQAQTVLREAQTRVNTIMGSTHYLAPERLVQQEVGPEADVFALGCTLFEALAGEALFARKSMRQMYLLMVDERKFDAFVAERCAAYPARMSERICALLRAMTAWKKQSRPTAAEVASRCDTLSDNVNGGETEGFTLTQWCRSRTWPPCPAMRGPLEGITFASAVAEEGVQRLPSPLADDDLPHMIPVSGASAKEVLPHELYRPNVLGETSGQVQTGTQTAVKRGIAAESPSPWAPAEIATLLQNTFDSKIGRLPQLIRQEPAPVVRHNQPASKIPAHDEASLVVSATSALTVQNDVPEQPIEAPSTIAATLAEPDPQDAPTVDASAPNDADAEFIRNKPAPMAPLAISYAPGSPVMIGVAESLAARPQIEEPIENTGVLLFGTGPQDFPDEPPTVRISRSPGGDLSIPGVLPVSSATPAATTALYPSYDDEPATVPSLGTTSQSPNSPNRPTTFPPSNRQTPRSAEPKRIKRRRKDTRWLVAWGSSIAGLFVGSALLLVLVVAVWLVT